MNKENTMGEWFGTLILVLFIVSIPLSFINALSNTGSGRSPCMTYGYYLPITFVVCNINKDR